MGCLSRCRDCVTPWAPLSIVGVQLRVRWWRALRGARAIGERSQNEGGACELSAATQLPRARVPGMHILCALQPRRGHDEAAPNHASHIAPIHSPPTSPPLLHGPPMTTRPLRRSYDTTATVDRTRRRTTSIPASCAHDRGTPHTTKAFHLHFLFLSSPPRAVIDTQAGCNSRRRWTLTFGLVRPIA